MKGHSYIHCPDHWRLFHLTTNTENVIVPPKNIHKKEEDVWCCNCSRKGHFYNNCPISKSLCGFTDTVPYVVAYSKYFGANQKSRIIVFWFFGLWNTQLCFLIQNFEKFNLFSQLNWLKHHWVTFTMLTSKIYLEKNFFQMLFVTSLDIKDNKRDLKVKIFRFWTRVVFLET